MSNSDTHVDALPPFPGQEPTSPPAKRSATPFVVTAIVSLIVGISCGVPSGVWMVSSATDDQAASDAPTAVAAPAKASPAAPRYHTPTADDFELTVKVLEKECFGSAGCLLAYRIELTQLGSFTLDPSKEYELTYEITGGEEPQINTMTLTGSQYRADDKERIRTPSSKSVLNATITDVSEH